MFDSAKLYNESGFKKEEDAKALADIMTKIGELAGIKTVCIITDMNQPVGYAVGNSLEVIETIDILKGKYLPEDISNIITELGGNMLLLANKVESLDEGRRLILDTIKNGKAYKKFIELVRTQGGDVSYIENTEKFERAKYIEPIIAKKSGTISKLDAYQVGILAGYLGAGRTKKEDEINPRVGFVFNKKVGDIVNEGDILGYIHSDDEKKLEYVMLKELFEINN